SSTVLALPISTSRGSSQTPNHTADRDDEHLALWPQRQLGDRQLRVEQLGRLPAAEIEAPDSADHEVREHVVAREWPRRRHEPAGHRLPAKRIYRQVAVDVNGRNVRLLLTGGVN